MVTASPCDCELESEKMRRIMPPSRSISVSMVGRSMVIEVGSSMPWKTLRGSKVSEALAAVTMATRLGELDARLQQPPRPPHRMSWLSTARLPRPHDPERRDVAWTRWNEKATRPGDPTEVALLDALFGNSPYLTETALQNPV